MAGKQMYLDYAKQMNKQFEEKGTPIEAVVTSTGIEVVNFLSTQRKQLIDFHTSKPEELKDFMQESCIQLLKG